MRLFFDNCLCLGSLAIDPGKANGFENVLITHAHSDHVCINRDSNFFFSKQTHSLIESRYEKVPKPNAKDFKQKYNSLFKIALTTGDLDNSEQRLADCDLIVCTAEKLDSITRHKTQWINEIGTVIIDEIHLLNDITRGPTLEILITFLRQIVPKAQFIGLSATIGNPQELADWLNAELVLDNWRPVPLHKGVYYNGKIMFDS